MKIKHLAVAVSLCMASTGAFAYQAGDIVVRGGAVYAKVKSSSDSLTVGGAASNIKAEADNNTQFGLNLQYMLTDHFGVELLGATPFSHKIKTKGGLDIDLAKVKQLPPTLSLLWYPMESASSFQPYVGLGLNYTTFFDSKLTGDAEREGFSGVKLDSSWGLAGVVGADYMIDDNWLVNGQIRYIDMKTTATTYLNGIQVKGDYDLNPWVFMVSVGYRF